MLLFDYSAELVLVCELGVLAKLTHVSGMLHILADLLAEQKLIRFGDLTKGCFGSAERRKLAAKISIILMLGRLVFTFFFSDDLSCLIYLEGKSRLVPLLLNQVKCRPQT